MLTSWLTLPAQAVELSYYFDKLVPGSSNLDPEVPAPSELLGFEVGEWHVRPEQSVDYLQLLARRSPRVLVEEIGRTHEQRPLLQAIISSPANRARIDEIRAARAAGKNDGPLIVWLGYSVHGNEASGANAALLMAYYLAAARDPALEKLLERTVIILDPALNPDGMTRFSSWVNSYRGRVLVPDNLHAEHREIWPNGRGNHYWFDLNRDWLMVQQPESYARVLKFQEWKPHVLGDFHEMGTDGTYFFQPGVPARQNPLTPAENLKLTDAIARYHAAAFDADKRLYYSKEGFDDFYYGKGSTYPDIQGSVGILFEQASARGHVQNSKNGPISFPFAIRNQLTTSLSTLRAADEQRQQLMSYQSQFYADAAAEASKDEQRAIVFAEPSDPAREYQFLRVLQAHGIVINKLAADVRVDGNFFAAGRAYVIALEQRQYRLIKSLFETRKAFASNVFYDVSAWTLPLAFDMPQASLGKSQWRRELLGERVQKLTPPAGKVQGDSELAYAFAWDSYYAPRAANQLLREGYKLRVVTKPMTVKSQGASRELARGSIVIPLGIQSAPVDKLRALLADIANRDAIDVWPLQSGYAEAGTDLGSPSLKALATPNVLLLIGAGVDANSAGEIWHLLDYRMHLPLTMSHLGGFADVNLNDYSHLILADGRYKSLNDEQSKRIAEWVKAGGTLIAIDGAVQWASQQDFVRNKLQTETDTGDKRLPYASMEEKEAEKKIAGAILLANLDRSHPLGFGFARDTLPLFRTHTDVLPPLKSPYATAAQFTDAPVLAGFVSEDNVKRLAGSAALAAEKVGNGTIVLATTSLAFRASWFGSSKLLMNAIFFAPIIDKPADPGANVE
ncbi:hypothetical protein HPT27_07825 [Permianibacter sp. IMCC34836]|uniref:M14 metallopeptidase family protein n=1 Tax=Permianibacter fluminis TaxID=2738515 RepID=UPI001551C662|nr:M14 metallopeptidase family protein [Permianibacter fluminis]NQD36932.1 hypothetical protein [Permianibacter fluminis]